MKNFLFLITLIIFQTATTQQKNSISKQLDSINRESTENEFSIIENVPIYKGCENKKGNANKKACMSKKIGNLFGANFNTVIHENSNLKPGMTRMLVNFKINKKGKIIDAEVKAQDKYLEAEALRILKMIPDFKPGLQRGEPVTVPYTLPLIVELESKVKVSKNQDFPIFRGCDETLNYKEQKKCTEKKIIDFIRVSFDYDIADRALPLEKTTQFELNFTVNKKGKVENVTAKANHKAIAIEAIRTAKRLPKFKEAGMRNGKPIDTPMSITMKIYF